MIGNAVILECQVERQHTLGMSRGRGLSGSGELRGAAYPSRTA